MGILLTASPTLREKAAATGAGLAKWKAGAYREGFFGKKFLRLRVFQILIPHRESHHGQNC